MTITSNIIVVNGFDQMDNIELATFIYIKQQRAAETREEADRASQALLRRMEAVGARAVDHPGLEVALVQPSPKFDVSILATLGELLEPETIAKARTPAHEITTTVPEAWDGRVLQHWPKRYGAAVAAIIEEAKMPGGPPRLKITPKALSRTVESVEA